MFIVIFFNFGRDSIFYVIGEKGIYKSIDVGKNWEVIIENIVLEKVGKM